jgi:hypothetical protein
MTSAYPTQQGGLPSRAPRGPLDFPSRTLRKLPANDPRPLMKSSAMSRLSSKGLLKLGGRFVPVLSALLLLYDLYALYEMLNRDSDEYDMSGWTHICGSGASNLINFDQPCGTTETYISQDTYDNQSGKLGGFPSLRTAHFWQIVEPHPDYSGVIILRNNTKYKNEYEYDPPVPSKIPAGPSYVPKGNPINAPSPIPTLAPDTVPIHAPSPIPVGIPYKVLPALRVDPNKATGQNREVRYEVPPSFTSRPELAPDELPLAAPTQVISSSPSALPRNIPTTHKLTNRARKKGEKERKLKAKSFMGFALRIGSGVTEMIDLVDVLYEAIPFEYKPRYITKDGYVTRWVLRHPSPLDKMQAIYTNFDKIPLADAIEGLILNELEDRFYGTIGKKVADASQNLKPHGNLRIGYAAGPAI